MKTDLYKRHIIEHYKNPKNFSKLTNFNCSSSLANSTCGDEIEVFLNIEGDILKDISFQGRGCAISLASMSMLGEKVKGKTLREINLITDDMILEMLGMNKETPRIKCALLGIQTLRNAFLQHKDL